MNLDKIKLGDFRAKQFYDGDLVPYIFPVSHHIQTGITEILIDIRKAGFTVFLNERSKCELIAAIRKALEWDTKAKEAFLEATKEIANIPAPLSFDFGDEKYTSNSNCLNLTFSSAKETNGTIECFVNITSMTMAVEYASVPAVVLSLTIEELNSLLAVLETDVDIKKREMEANNKKIDDILN